MKLPDVKYAIPAETLNATIKVLEFAQTRSEQEAASLFYAACSADEHDHEKIWRLGLERMELAEKAAELVDFYLHL